MRTDTSHNTPMPVPRMRDGDEGAIMRLWARVPAGTDIEAHRRALEAARQVFEAAKLSPWDCSCASYDRDLADDLGNKLADAERVHAAAETWRSAEIAAGMALGLSPRESNVCLENLEARDDDPIHFPHYDYAVRVKG